MLWLTCAQQKTGSRAGPGADAVALVRDDRGAAAGHRQHLPSGESGQPDSAAVEPRVQRAGAAAVRGVAPGDALGLPAGPHSALPLPVPAHAQQDATVRVPAPHLARRYRRPRQDRRTRGATRWRHAIGTRMSDRSLTPHWSQSWIQTCLNLQLAPILDQLVTGTIVTLSNLSSGDS